MGEAMEATNPAMQVKGISRSLRLGGIPRQCTLLVRTPKKIAEAMTKTIMNPQLIGSRGEAFVSERVLSRSKSCNSHLREPLQKPAAVIVV
jgi:hypothetical protein